MSIEITPLGGMGEIGKNMTVLSFEEGQVIVDMGIRLEKVLELGNRNIKSIDREKLVRIGGIPDDSKVRADDVSAIILTHGHLDHIGAIGKLAHKYEAPIYATSFTAELVKQVIQGKKKSEVDNDVKEVKLKDSEQIGDLEVEFIPGAHSIPQNNFPTIHSSEGTVICVGGFKIDRNPVLGSRTDHQSIKRLENEGSVTSLVCSVKADKPSPTPSESHAQEMLEDVMSEASDQGRGLLITTFSTHIARIKTIIEIAYELERRPIILGRSLREKCKIASGLGLINFPSDLRILGHRNSIRKALETINESREDYVVITTGHQGEPNALLSRIADREEPYKIKPGDEVIFSASVIPNPINEANREKLETKLEAQGAHIHRNIHVSGHAGKPGTKKLIKEINPDHLIPFHGTVKKMKCVLEIGREIGHSEDQLHMLKNGQTLSLGA